MHFSHPSNEPSSTVDDGIHDARSCGDGMRWDTGRPTDRPTDVDEKQETEKETRGKNASFNHEMIWTKCGHHSNLMCMWCMYVRILLGYHRWSVHTCRFRAAWRERTILEEKEKSDKNLEVLGFSSGLAC